MDSPPRIWVLTDDKPGNRTQAIGVAEKLGLPFEEKNLTLTRLSGLPNRLLGRSRAGTSSPLSPPWPDIAIAAGRRLVPVLRYLKKQNPQCFTMGLMRPDVALRHLDLIAIPAHDAPRPRPNVIETLGAPHAVTPEKLNAAAQLWSSRLPQLSAPRIALLVGGNSASAQYSAEDFHELGALASDLANQAGGSLLVTTSRRTGKMATDYLRLALSAEHELFCWQPEAENPYHAFLGLADAVIVTGDSMSMCAEACATGKPVFIFVPRKGKLAPKCRMLHEALVERGLARYLSANESLDWQPTAPLDEAGRIAAEIQERTGLQ